MGTMQNLYREERQDEILLLVNQEGRVEVGELSQQFGVSTVTIRGDLQALADRDLLVRTHGGAVSVADGHLALTQRRRRQVAEKTRIGQAGATLVADGDAVFLDGSSTSLAIAHYLRNRRYVTTITNSLAVAQELLDAPGVSVVLTGGILQKESASLIGDPGLANLEDLHIRCGFFGAHGITRAEGLTDVHADVAAYKKPLIALCRQVVAVVDATKWGRVGVMSFAALTDVSTVITGAGAPQSALDEVRAAGVEVVIV